MWLLSQQPSVLNSLCACYFKILLRVCHTFAVADNLQPLCHRCSNISLDMAVSIFTVIYFTWYPAKGAGTGNETRCLKLFSTSIHSKRVFNPVGKDQQVIVRASCKAVDVGYASACVCVCVCACVCACGESAVDAVWVVCVCVSTLHYTFVVVAIAWPAHPG